MFSFEYELFYLFIMKQKTTELWIKFAESLRRFIVSKVKDEVLADDLLQEAFVRIHLKVDELRDETKMQAWVYQIARNLITDHYRKSTPVIDKQVPDIIDNEQESDDAMSSTLHDMVLMMEEMPALDCQALCEVEFEGISIKDYAEKAGISYTAAKSRVARARYKLSDLLMNCCHYEFDKYGTVISYHPIKCCCCSHP